jgi:hypothetical protein
MNAMKQPTTGSLSLFVGLLSFAVVACSGAGQDLLTVGVRPTDKVAASGGTAAGGGGAGGLPTPGSDVMNPILDGNSPTGVAATGASGGHATASPDAAIASAADAGIIATDAGGSLGANDDECGAMPSQPASGVTSGRVSGPGLIEYAVDVPNVFIGLRTTLAVPAEPPPDGQIFIWPGLQPTPHGENLEPIGNGALMSVLAWGPSCPADAPESYSTWWIVPMYSNISSSDPQYAGCHSGKVELAKPEQRLDIDMHLDGTTWVQKVVNRDTTAASDFRLDLNGQAQGRVFFDIELPTSNKPTEDIVFTNTVLSMDTSAPDACEPVTRGMNDFASKPRVSKDGKHCCIDRIVLRAAGVMATTPDAL